MKKIFYKLLFYLIMPLMICSQSKDSGIGVFFDTPVLIRDKKIKHKKYEGKDYEIWLKDIQADTLKPLDYFIKGTGFFVFTDFDLYFVTAEHLAKETTLNTDIIVSSKNERPIKLKLKNILFDSTRLNWTTHSTADVSVIRLSINYEFDSLGVRILPFDIINYKLEAPRRDREVTIYGFPLGLGVGKTFSPISKTLKPSSGLIDLGRFDKKDVIATFFLLDDPSISGFSGSPLFELPQTLIINEEQIFVKAYRLMGLVHGTIGDKNSGFAAIVPSIFIKETIEKAPGYSGEITYNYDNGNIWSERIYKDGVPWTVMSNYDSTGNPQEKGTLRDGDGSLYIYSNEGKLNQIRYYNNGSLISIENIKKINK